MIPNMFKIAGELTPTVIHVAARTLATHALSIFGDHSDVMHARATGWAMLAAGSVQEAHDFALDRPCRHAPQPGPVPALLRRLPDLPRDQQDRGPRGRRPPGARPRRGRPRLPRPGHDARTRPMVRGTAQNPDVFFQAREAANPYHLRGAGHRPGGHGRAGRPDRPPLRPRRLPRRARRRAGHRGHGLRRWRRRGDGRRPQRRRRARSGCSRSACSSPFPADAADRRPAGDGPFDRRPRPDQGARRRRRAALPRRSSRRSPRRWTPTMPPFAATPRVIGGRYGLSSKEVTPSMIKPIFDELGAARPKRHFTVGIYDDVTHLSLPIDRSFRRTPGRRARSRPSSSASARTARSAPTRPRSRSSARARTSTPRATSSTTPRSRARSPSRTCASGRSRSARPT